MEGRNPDGTFGEGNKFRRKRDMTKEAAKDMVSKEMWWLSKLLTDASEAELDAFMDENAKSMSILASRMIKQIKKGDVKAMQWFVEMMIGRPSQQIEHSTPEGKKFQLGYSLNGRS